MAEDQEGPQEKPHSHSQFAEPGLVRREDGTFEVVHNVGETLNVLDEMKGEIMELGKRDPIYSPIFNVMDKVVKELLEANEVEDHQERDAAMAKALTPYFEAVHESAARLEEKKEEDEFPSGEPMNFRIKPDSEK